MSTVSLSYWRYGIFSCFVVLFVFSSISIIYIFFSDSSYSETIQQLPQIHSSDAIRAHDNHIFPHIVHQMWKTKDSLSLDFKRWRKGCQQLNGNYSFHLYDDQDLKKFTHQHYPEYVQLFDSLTGVYMADMARVLVAYHFGGLYIDLDFYCYRTFECLENYVMQEVFTHLLHTPVALDLKSLVRKVQTGSSHILVVSREPLLHSQYIHQKSRVVIQDFYFSTPKHPFFKWYLDKYNRLYHERRKTNTEQLKGPFSYSIQHVLDEYYQAHHHQLFPQQSRSLVATRSIAAKTSENTTSSSSQRRALQSIAGEDNPHSNTSTTTRSNSNHHSTTSTTTLPSVSLTKISSNNHSIAVEDPHHQEYILEMKSEVVHPLIDSTNSRLTAGCKDSEKNEQYDLTTICKEFLHGRYLFPTVNTLLVHMWTHSFLSWSFLRGWYEHSKYMNVENSLKPTYECPIASIH